MVEKFWNSLTYFASLMIGLITLITVGCPAVKVVSMGDVAYFNGFQILSAFKSGAGVFGGILNIFMLIIGVIMVAYSILLILFNFDVIKGVERKISSPQKLIDGLIVAQIVLSLIALIMFATFANSTSSTDLEFSVGGGAISSFVLMALTIIAYYLLPLIKDKKCSFKIKKFSFKKKADVETSEVTIENQKNDEISKEEANIEVENEEVISE